MAGLFGVLDLASRALQVNQQGLRVTSHNISNVDTPGYSRQRQILRSGLTVPNASGNLGTGVEQVSIERVTDEFIQRRLIQEHSSSGSLNVQADALSQVETIFNEQSAEGLTAQLSHFFDAFHDLAASSESFQPAEREALRGSGVALVDTLHRLDVQLRDLQRATDRRVSGLLPEINSLGERIAQLNHQIVQLEAVAPANDLRDQRDELVRELASKLEISQFENPDGSLVILFEGGIPLVDRGRSSRLVQVADPTNAFDPTFSSVFFSDGANFFDVTGSVGGGELGGLLRARDFDVAGAIRELDALAFTVVDAVNSQHRSGFGLDGVGGRDFFAAPAAVDDAARDIALSADILASTDAIAASDAGGAVVEGNTENASLMASIRELALTTYRPGDLPGAPAGSTRTVVNQAASLISDRGLAARSIARAREQQGRILQEIENRQDASSGVSIDEEVTDLIRLQASFQANSRVVSVINAMLEELVNIL